MSRGVGFGSFLRGFCCGGGVGGGGGGVFVVLSGD